MKKFSGLFAMGVVVFSFLGVFLCSNSQAAQAKGPSPELQKNAVISSMKAALIESNQTPFAVRVHEINEQALKYKMHPSVKKTIDDNQYTAWPIKVEGAGIIIMSSNNILAQFEQPYIARASYIVYLYTNNVGENKFRIEDRKVVSEKYDGPLN